MATKNILLVDDDNFFLTVTADLLREAGFGVVTAHSALEAIKLDLGGVGLILSDVEMAKMDGRALLEMVRELKGSRVPFVFLTAASDPSHLIDDAVKHDAEFLSKPVDRETLLATVERLLL